MHHEEAQPDPCVSIAVLRNWLDDAWEMRWFVIAPDGELTADGCETVPCALVDASELEGRVAALYGRLAHDHLRR